MENLESIELLQKKHGNGITKPARIVIYLMLLLIIVFISSFCFGRYNVNLHELLRILANRVIPLEHTWTAEMETVVINIRLPRIVLACLVGCCLSVAGASYQGVFQNPMASPDFLGATSGAAFGAALAILLGSSSRMITILAFFFSLVSVFLVYFIGRYAPGKGVINMILAGIMISSLFTAGTSFIKLVADPNNQLPAITYWLMGSLSGAKNNEVVFALIPMAIGMIPLFVMRWRINILTLSDEESNAIGINANMLRLIVIISSTLITAASVSVSGTIGWVGLVIPHLCRRMIGNNYTYLLPASMAFGATFMLLVDNISRNLLATEIPIGILTAFIGAPFFIRLIFRREGTL